MSQPPTPPTPPTPRTPLTRGAEASEQDVVYRRAGRLALLDPDNRILMSNDTWGGNAWWSTPGGGIEGDETPEQAAVREGVEETGFTDIEVGPLIIRYDFRALFMDRVIDQQQWIFLARTQGGEPDTSGWNGDELDFMLGFRWWSLDELASTEETVYPRRLAEAVAHVLTHGPPAKPWHLE